MTVLIEAVGLQKQFGEIKAVDGISLKVTKGEVSGSRAKRRRQVDDDENDHRVS